MASLFFSTDASKRIPNSTDPIPNEKNLRSFCETNNNSYISSKGKVKIKEKSKIL